MKTIFSFDDGSLKDIQTAGLLEEYGFKGIFYIPSSSELNAHQIKWLSDRHTIGGHTVSHPILRELSPNMQLWEILKNKQELEIITYKEITTFAYPKGKYNFITKAKVKEAGFKEARTTDVFVLGETDPYAQGTAIHIYPHRVEYGESNWLDLAKEWYKKAKKENKTYRVWGHSWEIEKFDLWEEFEELLKYVSK